MAEQTEQSERGAIRAAYQPRLAPLPDPAAAAPKAIDKLADKADAVMARWNEKIPRNKVRVLNRERFIAIGRALEIFSLEEILAAIDYYSAQSWQRKKNAWKKFDNFMEPRTLTAWVEECLEAAEKAEAEKPVKDARVAALQEKIAQQQVEMDRRDALRSRFAALPDAEKKRLLAKAVEELRRLQPGSRHAPPVVTIRTQALVILEREPPATRDQAPGERPKQK